MNSGIENLKDIIQLATSLTALVLSVAGLIFSIYVYRSVSLKSDFKKKQLGVVLKLCDELQETIISVEWYGVDTPIEKGSSGNMWRFFQINSFDNNFKEFATEVFFVTEDPDKKYKFIEYCEHPYIPTQIASKIRPFIGYVYDPVDYKQYNSFTVLGGCGILDYEKDSFYKIENNPVYENLPAFLSACRDLDNEIHKWLKSVGITDLNKKNIIY